MRNRYNRYYLKHSIRGNLKFLWDSLFAATPTERLSLMNRMKDYSFLMNNPELLDLHRRLDDILWRSCEGWKSYDYGGGYFYQGSSELHITGLRDTDSRVAFFGLLEKVRNKDVFEIGCNTGLLTLALAKACNSLVGIDVNPYLIEVATTVRTFLNVENCQFFASSFEEWDSTGDYDVVISFANHSTFDQNTHQSITDYFERCWKLIREDGTLLFESHPPEHEGDNLPNVLKIIDKYFEIQETVVCTVGTFLDRNRTLVAAKRRKAR